MTVLLNVLIVAALAAYMEYVAYFTHKHVMHGFLWVLHQDHHRPRGRGFQKNDLFAIFFASISFLLIATGVLRRVCPLTSAGLGVALYGVGYFLFHDVMFHRRLRGIRLRPHGRYLERIVRAHKAHHQHGGRKDAVSFSFLYAGKQYAE
jgi:beta-carotene 3-hydroxylase